MSFKQHISRPETGILIFLGMVVWLICLPLFQDGMFMDGIQYAAVSRNLAKGIGSFWFPVLSPNSVAGLDTFHEHPPLVFFIQSWFFKLFGVNNIYPERIYCLFTYALTAWLITMVWKEFFRDHPVVQNKAWLPLIIWTGMPIVFWAYVNNIQENTMGVFTMAALYLFLRSQRMPRPFLSVDFYLGCLAVFSATLCKGVPGLYPLAAFPIYWVVFRSGTILRASINTLAATAVVILFYSIVLQNHTAYQSLHLWFYDRMMLRIASDPVVTNRFSILFGLFMELLPGLLFFLLLFLFFRKEILKSGSLTKPMLFFLLMGLSASLPLMLTLVQRNFYFTPSLPLFAMALGCLMANPIVLLIQKMKPQLIQKLNILFFSLIITGIAITMYKAGTCKRDKEMLSDVHSLGHILPQNSTVRASPELMWVNWSMRCYMVRYNSINFSELDTFQYFIASRSESIPEHYVQSKALKTVALYRVRQ